MISDQEIAKRISELMLHVSAELNESLRAAQTQLPPDELFRGCHHGGNTQSTKSAVFDPSRLEATWIRVKEFSRVQDQTEESVGFSAQETQGCSGAAKPQVAVVGLRWRDLRTRWLSSICDEANWDIREMNLSTAFLRLGGDVG